MNQITQRMEENKRKAMSETDPIKKVALIQSIEEDGLLLQQKYKKKQELSNKFNFDPKKKVDDLIESMKKAIKKGKRKKPGGSGEGNHENPNSSDTESSDSEDEYNTDDDNNNTNFLQTNQQLVIIAGLALLVIFYLMNQKPEKEPNYYDF